VSTRSGLQTRLAAASRRRGPDRGSTTLEFAILIPGVLVMMFLCIQIALYSYARSVALTAAEQGVNAQRAYGAKTGAGKTKATTFITNQGNTLSNIKVTTTMVGGEIRITVTGTSLSVIPGVKGYTVSQSASGPIEKFSR
jgi:Flp pilus assembly protein TadG